MKKLLPIAFLITVGFIFAACKQDPESSTVLQMKTSANSGTAHPAIAYTNTGYKLCVMDTDGTHQATLYTPASGNIINARPSWSPSGNSIAFIEHPGGTYYIKL